MITNIFEFKKYQLIKEFNSSFETSYPDMLPYGMQQDILYIKKDIKNTSKKNINFKIFLRDILDNIISLPYTIKIDIIKYALIVFSGSILLSDINYAFASVDKNNDFDNLKSEVINMAKNTDKMINNKTGNNMANMTQLKSGISYSDTLIDFLKFEEGRQGKAVLTAYDIGDGMITIGYGHAERKSVTKMIAGVTKITEDEAVDLLIEDIKEAQKGVDRILRDMKAEKCNVDITQNMYDAMISLTYNMGIGNMRKSTFLKKLKSGDIVGAGKQILIQNVTYPGHVKRRKKESFLFTQKNDVNINQLLAIK